ncbi:DUF4383 domain-containing protein [Actinomycetospora chibensis]|uniref:DUF4383 domain-containing protein n=1 Tax=Actinomycetospora chibensis TaxID=663606 RepID=A0ABV9RQ39_9PSEU|nr:DUF4383 domain-containing protein [Actinomycetospora chibensis]MDD7922371.1 DUF4383 domain-containing protein [Actinomycetospora chibensis]
MSADQDDRGTRSRVADAVRPDHGVLWVHRVGAVVVAVIIATIGVLGFVGGLGFFDTEGATMPGGLSTNGALSTVSVVTAVILLAAAVRGGKLASTVMIVIGALFLVSAFGNLALIGTPYNLLAFRLPNVFFSIGAGLVLLLLGAYGRISSKLPPDNPYRRERGEDDDEPEDAHRQSYPASPAQAAADAAMAAAARAIAQGTADDEQRRRMRAADEARNHEDRRAIWMAFDGRDPDGVDRQGSGESSHGSAMA